MTRCLSSRYAANVEDAGLDATGGTMGNYELTPDETAIRLNLFRKSLNAHGVPHAVYDEYTGEVLINLGGESTPFGGYVQC